MKSISKIFVLLFLIPSLIYSKTYFGITQFINEELPRGMIHHCIAEDWVAPIAFSDIKSDEEHSGFIYLLLDKQVHAPLSKTFYHMAIKLLSPSSIEYGSQVKISFHPAFNKVNLHSLRIHRDGKIIDRLKRSRFKIIEEEEMADSLIYTEEKSLLIFVEDVREKDILEYSYTIDEIDPYESNEIQEWFIFRTSTFAKNIHSRLVTDEKKEIFIKNSMIDLQPQTQCLDNHLKEWVWEIFDVDPIHSEGNKPSWFNPYPHVQVTSFKTWEDVAHHFIDFYKKPDFYDEILTSKVKEWQRKFPSIEEQILAAIRFVQNEIRYLSLHEGLDVTKAHDPSDVVERRWGDCKDKTILLITFLELLDVKAHPALVHTKRRVSDFLPSNVFDHVIVSFEFDGKNYYVDPTITHQGGTVDSLYVPHYKHALLLKNDSEGLSEIPFSNIGKDKQTFTVSINTKEKSAKLETKRLTSGNYADRSRSMLKEYTSYELKNQFIDDLYDFFDSVDCTKGPVSADNLNENTLLIQASYDIKGVGEQEGEMIYFHIPTGRLFDISSDFSTQRKSPLRQAFPLNMEEEYEIQLDEKLDNCHFFGELEPIFYQDQYLNYEIHWAKIDEYSFRLNVKLKTLKDSVAMEDLENYRDQIELLQQQLSFGFEVSKEF